MVLQRLTPLCWRMGPFVTQPWFRGLPKFTLLIGVGWFRSRCRTFVKILSNSMMFYPHGAAL